MWVCAVGMSDDGCVCLQPDSCGKWYDGHGREKEFAVGVGWLECWFGICVKVGGWMSIVVWNSPLKVWLACVTSCWSARFVSGYPYTARRTSDLLLHAGRGADGGCVLLWLVLLNAKTKSH